MTDAGALRPGTPRAGGYIPLHPPLMRGLLWFRLRGPGASRLGRD